MMPAKVMRVNQLCCISTGTEDGSGMEIEHIGNDGRVELD